MSIGVELEVVPTKVAEVITKKVDIMTLSMGSGSGCDGQYLFANDVLGYTKVIFLDMQEYIEILKKNLQNYKKKE